MLKRNIEIMRKILYAVESGGQVYGRQDYSAFAGVGANTSNEKAITIGAGQWYANEAKALLKKIKEKAPEDFKRYDTGGIASDLKKSWAAYGVTKSSLKGKAIIAIISCDSGVKCQDELMEEQIVSYSEKIEKAHGAMADGAMMECINIIHQGGSAALKRVLKKTATPYSTETIYAALCTDPEDKSNDNQVGDYTARQKKVYEFINKYSVREGNAGMTENELRQSVCNTINGWIGATKGSAKHMEILNTYNNHKPLARGYAVQKNDAYCATTVSAAYIKAGIAAYTGTECGVENYVNVAKGKGIWQENDAYMPSLGDACVYDWDDSGVGDNTGYSDHIGIVTKVNGKTSFVVTEGNMSGGVVGTRTVQVNQRYIRGFIIPDFNTIAKGMGGSAGTAKPAPSAPAKGSSLSKTEKFKGYVTADPDLSVRTWAGMENKACSFSPLKQGTEISVCDTVKADDGAEWYYIMHGGKYGFVCADGISKSKNGASGNPGKSSAGEKKAAEGARSHDTGLAGSYRVIAGGGLNIRNGAGTAKNKFGSNKSVLVALPYGAKVQCYGYYTTVEGTKWLYVQAAYNSVKYTGFASSRYLDKQ